MLVLRQVKGSPLTIAEEDGNFTYLEGLYEFIATNPSLLINGSNSMQADLKVGGNALLNVTRISDPLGASAIVLTSGERILAASDGTDFIYFDDRSLGLGIKNPGNKISRIKNTSTSDEVFLLPDKAGAGGTFAMLSDIASAGITALTGDVSASGTGSVVATLATVNSNIGTFNNVTVNAKGLVTAASNVYYLTTISGITAGGDLSGTYANPNVIAIQGKGITLATGFLKYNGTAFVFDGSTYLTANQTITLSGEASGSGTTAITVTLSNSAVIGKVLTGYVSGAGTVSATDSILQAIQKLNGNISAIVSGVSSVIGTTNRITSSGGSTPVIDISTSYVGQTSITTLGTIATGTWQGTPIADAYILSAVTWNGKFTLPSLSSGSVLFSNGTTISQDNSNFFYDATNHRLGIGTNAPATMLHIVDTGTATPRGVIHDQYSTGVNSAQHNLRKARGTFASPTTIVTADVISNINSWSYDGTNFLNSAAIRVTSIGTIATGRTPTTMGFYTMTDVTTGVLTLALTLDQNQKATFANTVELTSISLLDTTYKSAISVLSANNLLLGGSGWTNNIYGDINLRDSAATYRQLFTGGNNTFTIGSGFNSMSIAAYASFTKTITFTSSDISSINVSALINSTAGSFIASAYRWTSGINQTGGTGIIAGLCLTPSVSAVFTGSTLAGIYSNIATIAPGSGTAYFINHIGTAASLFGGTITYKGFADASNASAGNVGEVIDSTISTFTNYTTSATYQNITSITLTAGDWDIYAFGTFSSNSATITAGANTIFNIATATASATGAIEGKTISYIPQSALIGTSIESCGSMRIRVSISATTIYYLNTQATFTLLNPQFTGSISARRIR